MRRIILVHGYGATPHLYWFPWLARELEARGHAVIMPTLSEPFRPDLHTWISELQTAIGEFDENTIVVAHSLGNSAVARMLQDASPGVMCRAYIAVAPLILERYGKLFPTFFEKPIDASRLVAHAGKISVLHDPADRWAPISNGKFLQQACGARLIECPGQHHFNNLNSSMPVPEILAAVLEAINTD